MSSDSKIKAEPDTEHNEAKSLQRTSSSDLALPSTSHEIKTETEKSLTDEEKKKLDEKKKEKQDQQERERMLVLVSQLTEDQLDRYEMYRRATFPKAAVKRIMQTITGSPIGPNVVISMSGIAKVFAGEVIEEALDYMESLGETGPLRPKHLREGARKIRLREKLTKTNSKSKNVFM